MFSFGMSPFFTPSAVATAAAGGMLLGCAVVFKTGVLSGVLGISTYTKRLFVNPSLGRYAFVGGMIASAAMTSALYGGAEHMTFSAELLTRLGVGAFFVGVGASMQKGCTSGHGLTGLARLSLRSWVAVPLFMLAGILTATLSKSASAFPPNPVVEAGLAGWHAAVIACASIATLLAILAGLSSCRQWEEQTTAVLSVLGELVIGLSFGSGLVISGMSRPSKVAAFLDIGSGAWDLSLAFVMGGALLVTFPYFQSLERLKAQEKPLLASTFDIPAKGGAVDHQLLMGAVLFGMGWGTCGMCPGPIWVNVGSAPSLQVLVALVGLLLGIGAWEVAQRHFDSTLATTTAGATQDAETASPKVDYDSMGQGLVSAAE
mmetsp:Transcript_8473/g.22451  ORF Transcript_8473/g.22451 Transcript_8473/m.22451 type:complete len:374 (-) Transcript_8473:167-1288(-)